MVGRFAGAGSFGSARIAPTVRLKGKRHMRAKITITKVHESHGEPGRRYHQDDSRLVAEERQGWLVISVKQGARRSPPHAHPGSESTPESVGVIALSRDEVRSLAAFLASLPSED